MGDPRRLKNKYNTPFKPWHGPTIEFEAKIKKDYGLKNKREIYLANTFLKKYKDLAKKLIAQKGSQAEKEKASILAKLERLGLLPPGSGLDNILNLELKDILERRLQTRLYRAGLSRSISQARQFISHRHVSVAGREITAPSHFISIKEESQISFKPSSLLQDINHPERINIAPQIQNEAQAIKPHHPEGAPSSTTPPASRKDIKPSTEHKQSSDKTHSKSSTLKKPSSPPQAGLSVATKDTSENPAHNPTNDSTPPSTSPQVPP